MKSVSKNKKQTTWQPPPCYTYNLQPGDAALVSNNIMRWWSNNENYIEVTNLPSVLPLITFTTSGLCIASKCVIRSSTFIFGDWVFKYSNRCSVGLSVLQVSKLLETFLGISNFPASWTQFFNPSFCLSSKKAMRPIISGLLSNKLHTEVPSFTEQSAETIEKNSSIRIVQY